MVKISKQTFFNYARKSPLGGRLTHRQVEGFESILAECEQRKVYDFRKVAYILATAFHETGGKMIPVREGFAKSDAAARRILKNRRYAQPDQTSDGKNNLIKKGKAYYGRGYVQLTWADNYLKMGRLIGLPLHANPDIALDEKIGAQILVLGMIKGKFTGRKLDDYFKGPKSDPVGARKIINGTDKAKLIATYFKAFHDALLAASERTPQPDDAVPALAKPDAPNLLTDKTMIGGISAVASSGAVGALSAVDSPWAFAAFALVAVGAFLFLTGRIKIARTAGA